MIIEHHNKTTIITQDKTSLKEFSKKLTLLYERFKAEDVIIYLINTSVGSMEDLISLAVKHSILQYCFVIVSTDLNQEDFENLIIIPTIQEAHDFIDMEVMQRDLGL
jgi:hypothetical protein|tara:strand:+ start:866 stop:1186 length:321 start_codon:yes stop_codon:yes gene_type:complete